MTNSWRPQMANGWWPNVHVVGDRIFLAWGNAEIWLAEFSWTVSGFFLVRQQLIDPTGRSPMWIGPGMLTWWKPDPADDQKGTRWQLNALALAWTGSRTPDDPNMVAGNDWRADGGHWASWKSTGAVVLDNRVLTGNSGPMRLAGDWLACGDGYPNPTGRWRRFLAGKEQAAVPIKIGSQPNGLVIADDGRMAYGFLEVETANNPADQVNSSCTPNRNETVAQIVRRDGAAWLVTIHHNDPADYHAVLLRPWPDGGHPGQDVLTIDVPAVWATVATIADQWLVATCDDRGQGLLQAVPAATVMTRLLPNLPSQGPKYLGYYYAAGRYGDFRPVQNCTVLSLSNFTLDNLLPADAGARMRAAAIQAGAIFIGSPAADIDTMISRWDLVHGIVLAEGGVTWMEAEAQAAKSRMADRGLVRKPVIATLMSQQVFDPGWRIPTGVDALAVEIYFDSPAPSFADQQRVTAQRIDQVLDRCGSLPVILIVQCFDRNGKPDWQTQTGRACLEAITATCLAADTRRVAGCWWFAYARPGGVRDYPELEPWHQDATRKAVRPAGLPLLPAKPDQAPLKATITGYSPNAGDAPLTVTAVAKIISGQADRLIWRKRDRGGATWTTDAVTGPATLSHPYLFDRPGEYEISLRVEGPAGADETGLQRLVTVTKKDAPVDPKNQISFQCYDGVHYLCAEDGGGHEGEVIPIPGGHRPKGLIVANRTGTGIWETFEVRPGAKPNTVGFRGHNGTWVSAQPDGTLVCNRDRPDDFVPDAWEAFEALNMGAGKAAFKTAHGWWITAEGGGGGAVTAKDRGDGGGHGPGIWETFQPTGTIFDTGGGGGGTVGGSLVGRKGIVRADGRVLVDDDGPFLAIGTTMFPLGWMFRHDVDRLRKNLAYLQGKVHYVRALAVVGGTSWEDRPMDPRWSDWQNVIAGATDLAYDNYGIRVSWTVFGGLDPSCPTRGDRDRVIQQIAQVIAGRPHKVIGIEVMNEAWQNGFGDKRDEARTHCQTLRKLTPCLVSVTAPQEQPNDDLMNQEVSSWYAGANANECPAHLDRSQSGSGELWRPVRQAWGVQFWPGNPPVFGHDQEHIGPKSSGGMDDDPERLTMARVAAWICGLAKSLLHTGAGVRMGGAADQGNGKPYLPREANIYEVKNIDVTLAAITALQALIPADIPAGAKQNSNPKFPDHPFDVAELPEEKVLRVYASNAGDHFAAACIQVKTTINLKAKRPMHVRVYGWKGDLQIEQDLAPGQAVQVSGPAAGAGYLVVGKYQ